MKYLLLLSVAAVSGCATEPGPDFSRMTPQQVMMYQQMQAQQQARDQQFYANLSAGNQALAGTRYPTMSAPQVTTISPGPGHVSCISTGIYTSCR